MEMFPSSLIVNIPYTHTYTQLDSGLPSWRPIRKLRSQQKCLGLLFDHEENV